MSEMVERVARRLYELDMAEEPMSHYRIVARAAIEAMREPTEAMVQVILGEEMSDAEAKWLWGMMIDEALK